MSDVPEDLRYTKEHEWIRREGDELVVGITDYAQESLGDVTFVELPDVGATLASGETFGVVESVKAASDLYMPVGGEVLAINEDLDVEPEKVNGSPYGDAWMVRLRPTDPAEVDGLLDAAAYRELI